MTTLGILKQNLAPEVAKASTIPEWHQDCLVVTVLLASALSEKQMKKLLRRGGCAVEPNRGGELLGELYEGCHHNPDLRGAIAKEMGRKFNNTVIKTASLGVEDILKAADERPWLPPLIWACYQQTSPDVQALGRRLAHRTVLRGMQGLRSVKQESGESRERQARLATQNSTLNSRLAEINAENQFLKTQLNRIGTSKAAPARPQMPTDNSNKKKIKRLNKQIHQLKKELKKQQHELAVWRGLALSEKDEGVEQGQVPNECRAQTRRCARMQDGASIARADYANARSCHLRGRKVAVIGGLDRLKPKYCKAVEKMGGECLFHTGGIRSGVQGLRNVVTKSDLVVYITVINNHGAMKVVKKHCKRCQKPFCPLRGASVGALENLLWKIEKQGEVLEN